MKAEQETAKGIPVNTKKLLAMGMAASTALIVLAACSNSTTEQSQQGSSSSSASTPAADAHNQHDVMFAQHMIPHHQQAIEMSDVVLGKQGIDGRVVDLAEQIKAAQGPEIEQMQSWLTQWGQPAMPMTPGMQMPGQSPAPGQTSDPHHSGTPNPTTTVMPGPSGMPGMPTQSMTPGAPSQSMMPGAGMMPGMSGMDGMMGMMSEQDMDALKNAQGIDAAKLFLTQMIHHHEGAIMMAQQEIRMGQYPAATAMAQAIVSTQQQEITTMNGILASL